MTRLRRIPAALAMVAVAVTGCGGEDPRSPSDARSRTAPVAAITDDRAFDRLVRSAGEPVLAVFWARWSSPDRIVIGHLDRVARERPGLRLGRVDVDRASGIAARYEVLSVPTAVVLADGRPRGRRVVGAYPRAKWERDLRLDDVAPRR